MLLVAAGVQSANLLQKLTDASQATVWDGVFDPFGEEVAVIGLAAMPVRFPGQYADEETGFSYNYFRDYAPTLGRYIESDPIGIYGGVNTYAYVNGNPLDTVDPVGLDGEPGLDDQFNPFGIFGDSTRDYTDWFNQRFPKTIAGALELLKRRIIERICASARAASLPGLSDSLTDIDIQPDMARFGDTPQGWWDRNVDIGAFQIKTDPISVQWNDGCRTCFSYETHAFVLEHTGDNSWYTLGMFRERDVRMATWPLSGVGCCNP
jgi:RHS repeat-associated protein